MKRQRLFDMRQYWENKNEGQKILAIMTGFLILVYVMSSI